MMWSLIHSPQYRAFALQECWRRIRSAFYMPKYIHHSRKCLSDQKPVIRWWWLPRKLQGPAITLTWRYGPWWGMLRTDLYLATVDTLLWLGLWELQEGGWYKDAQWRWAFWRTPYSVWQMRSPYRTVSDVVDTLCKRFYV